MNKQELLTEANAAVDSEAANAVEAHHKEVIKGLLALIPKAPEVEQEEMTVYGYTLVGQDGRLTQTNFATQQEAIEDAEKWNKDCQEAGIDWDYRIAAIVDQGGL